MSKQCIHIRAGASAEGRTGVTYAAGVSRDTAGSAGLSLQLASLAPGARSRVHQHDAHESAAYVIEGELRMWSGDRLEHEVVAGPGDFVYIPRGVPHIVRNDGEGPAVAVLARTDAGEQEDVTDLPELEDLPHVRGVTAR